LGAAEYYKDSVDGIVFLTTFPCGPDALAVSLCQSKMKGIPSIIVSLDELEGRVGLQTRLESFVDVINLKKCRKKK
jgi:predicted nucleotide-binding protein (sugar kinase/HSP70/actin superfamily)